MTLSVSIVSHGDGFCLDGLLRKLASLRSTIERVWVTFDVPEPEIERALKQSAWPFKLRVLCNKKSQSFARNHNEAFRLECVEAGCCPDYWWILNPDIDWDSDVTVPALTAFSEPAVGLVCPVQFDMAGQPTDFARCVPTPMRILTRWLCLDRYVREGLACHDWVNAACIFVRGEVFERLGGFDEKYRLYVEDVDFCLRLQLAGYKFRIISDAVVVHRARRRSRYHLRYMLWHLSGFIKLWGSSAFWKYIVKKKGGR